MKGKIVICKYNCYEITTEILSTTILFEFVMGLDSTRTQNLK